MTETPPNPADTPALANPPQANSPQANSPQARPPRAERPKRPPKVDVDGWVLLDKPVGMTSTHAVSVVRRIFNAKKGGHAGTLDPLASGCLPIALGEATKTVPFVMDGRKTYRFTVRWGERRDTDDAEGAVVATSAARPTADAILAVLPRYRGEIWQKPPVYSALKIDGERAYDLARDGETVDLAPRPVVIDRLDLVEMPDADHATFEAECGKGTYVRSLARDMGEDLGCHGHIAALRRTAVGPFAEEDLIPLDVLENPEAYSTHLGALLSPVEHALAEVPHVAVTPGDAGRLARGQSILLRGRDAPVIEGTVWVSARGALVALAEVEAGELKPKRIFQHAGR